MAGLLGAASATALVLDSGDGAGNTGPPSDDPGWARLGTKTPCPPQCGLSYVYLGRGWVLTAHHVSAQNVRLLATGAEYPRVPGSAVRLGGAGSSADLLLFRIADAPALPLLPISRAVPPTGTPVVLIAAGQRRGDALPGDPSPGWSFRQPSRLRWATNRISRIAVDGPTHAFSMRFERTGHPQATPHEGHAVRGDSGGAVFARSGGVWELAGIMIAATPALYNVGETIAADLSHYRPEILAIIGVPATASQGPTTSRNGRTRSDASDAAFTPF